jgi:hypothetical protein
MRKVFHLFPLISAWASPVVALPAELESDPPRLVVLVVVDQLVPEQLLRLEPWLDGGLGRLLR